MDSIQRIGVFTSGGDAPGMNACIRAVVRTAFAHDLEVIGIRRGYEGMIDDDLVELSPRSVSNILQKGGTILKSARSDRFRTPEGRAIAAENLRNSGINALVAIGGNGSMQGATRLNQEHDIVVVGCPGTIDNDLYGTDETIGYDTALNTAIQNIDRIRDTADAHNRLFLIEVMGRDAGFIALNSGIGGGAEMVLIPEHQTDLKEIRKQLWGLMSSHSRSSIVVVAEGNQDGGAMRIYESLKADVAFKDIDTRVTILGHIQRGGSPTARDRVLASRFGVGAVEALLEGHTNVMVGIIGGEIKLTAMKNVWSRSKSIEYELLNLSKMLS
jgi:6-phosphofructokinase 1